MHPRKAIIIEFAQGGWIVTVECNHENEKHIFTSPAELADFVNRKAQGK